MHEVLVSILSSKQTFKQPEINIKKEKELVEWLKW
jgi:hypothetical protein